MKNLKILKNSKPKMQLFLRGNEIKLVEVDKDLSITKLKVILKLK